MSVINKMLQDLDTRQNGARVAADLYVKPAAQGGQRVSYVLVGAVAAGVAVLAFAGAFAWRYWQHRTPQAKPVAAAAQAPVVIVPAPPTIAPLPAQPAAASVAAPELAPVAAPAAEEAPAAAVEQAEPVRKKAGPAQPARPAREARHAREKTRHADSAGPEAKARARQKDKAKAQAPSDDGIQGKEVSASQTAEAAYRRGLANLQEGYVSDAVRALEQALQANPRHEAARQTLIRVLIDNKHPDEAMQQLQLALTMDPRQPSMAMLLARLQIERGGSGIDTLARTLPFAGGNAEYHAFYAGALQRQQRHREAAEQYQQALRSLPQNGVWLMGLGISLQADKRDADALDAFRKARASGTLTPELLTFVDGKIGQLAH